MIEGDFDHIVIGAGSAGCVLANRLSADPRRRVLLVEAGGDDRPTRDPRRFALKSLIHVPAGYRATIDDPRIGWGHAAAFSEADGARETLYPRGRVLGGSSSINGMIYIRGQAADYDGWRQAGCTGWGWDDVLPLFRRSETNVRGADAAHGCDGPVAVSEIARDPVCDAVIAAAREAGHRETSDFNGGDQEGFGYVQTTMRRGRRSSAAAFVHAAEKRPNLIVATDTLATRIVREEGRAVAVRLRRGDREVEARCRGEIILSGGVINSPQLLELSGIGDPAVLGAAGIEVAVPLPGVGANLQDHWCVLLRYRLRAGVPSINQAASGTAVLGQMLRYALRRDGLLAQPPTTVCGFVRSDEAFDLPDTQVNAIAATADPESGAIDPFPGLTLAPCQLRPHSRGTVHVRDADPASRPRMVMNFLDAAEDRRVAARIIRLTDRLTRQPSLAALIDGPVNDCPVGDDDAALADFAAANGQGIYHGVGTCAMGVGADAVVDPQLRVRGVAGLRVADASIMPRIVSGNTNAAAMMIGEKASDLILSDRA